MTSFVNAAENENKILRYLTDNERTYTGPSVEDNIASMDADKNGFVDVSEIRAFLASRHGVDYEKDLLHRWQLRSQSRSCTLPPDEQLFLSK